MGLIQTELTNEQKILKTRAENDSLLLAGAAQLSLQHKAIWYNFWKNPYGLTCQQVCDLYGNDILAILQLAAQAKAIIVAVAPDQWDVPDLGTITPILDDEHHPTGGVTVTLNKKG